jgi:hypothetical protein
LLGSKNVITQKSLRQSTAGFFQPVTNVPERREPRKTEPPKSQCWLGETEPSKPATNRTTKTTAAQANSEKTPAHLLPNVES